MSCRGGRTCTPVRERVTGATVVRGTGFRDSARRESAPVPPPLVAATLLVEESVLTAAVPALRAMMPTVNTAAATFGLIPILHALTDQPTSTAYTTMLSS